MKKIVLIVALVIGFTTVNAQDIRIGVKAGLNLSKLSNFKEEKDITNNSRVSYHAGFMVEVKFNDKFAVQPELVYSTQGTATSYEFLKIKTTTSLKLDYINIPVMAKYFVTDAFSLEAGPQVGFLTSAKTAIKINDEETEGRDFKEFLSNTDFGMNFGVGFSTSNINLGVRYNLGLTDITTGEKTNEYSSKNAVIQVSLGFFF